MINSRECLEKSVSEKMSDWVSEVVDFRRLPSSHRILPDSQDLLEALENARSQVLILGYLNTGVIT